MKRHSLFGWLGAGAAVVIVVASVLVRLSGPADPAADVGDQRADVERFHQLVITQDWNKVYDRTTEPPGRDAGEFAALMRKQVREAGSVTTFTIDSLRLLRSRTVPMIEVRETVSLVTQDDAQRTERLVSYFVRKDDRWLFAFSAPDTARR